MNHTKIGIVGGGQLGLLLTQAAMEFTAEVSIYDPDNTCPAKPYTQHFTQGGFDDYDKIVAFGRQNEVIIFETEQVNIKALQTLASEGVKIVSSVKTLEWIQDKGVQKEKLQAIGMPVSDFKYVDKNDIHSYDGPFPIVQKWRTGGYDGYGVQIHKNSKSIKNAKAVDSIFEDAIDIDKEISVLMAKDESGNIEIYSPTEMVFEPTANLVDYLISPARLDEKTAQELHQLSKKMAESLDFIGVYAIEFFIDKNQKIYVNEVSPRPHNSGHHTVSAHVTSQYEQQIRIALGLPLGSSKQLSPCVLVNLLAEKAEGVAYYKGIKDAYKIPNVQYVLYGKEKVKPFRKMGHALIMEENLNIALDRMKAIRNTLTITSHE